MVRKRKKFEPFKAEKLVPFFQSSFWLHFLKLGSFKFVMAQVGLCVSFFILKA